ncbi:MAG: hypothetical protein ACR2NZ_05780 [Rubripirellula sp.]
MSDDANPYAPTDSVRPEDFGIRKVSVNPIELLKRSYALIGDQYWLFMGITIIGIIIGSAVPFGLIMGPILVGVYLCFIQRERGQKAEFATLFRGFDYFMESFIAFLIMIGISMVVILPFMFALMGMLLWPVISASQTPNGPPPAISPAITVGIVVMYFVMLAVNILVTLPFLFTFQLIADRNLKGVAAVKMSARGVIRNFWGVAWAMFVFTFISMLAAMACYFPVFFLLPITFGGFFVLYRDIFGTDAPVDPVATPQ